MPLEWKQYKYGSGVVADLGHGLLLTVDYESTKRLEQGAPPFNVTVFGRRLEQRSASLEAGKERARAVATKWLLEAQQKLQD